MNGDDELAIVVLTKGGIIGILCALVVDVDSRTGMGVAAIVAAIVTMASRLAAVASPLLLLLNISALLTAVECS